MTRTATNLTEKVEEILGYSPLNLSQLTKRLISAGYNSSDSRVPFSAMVNQALFQLTKNGTIRRINGQFSLVY